MSFMKICITSAPKNHYGNYGVFKDKGDYRYMEVPQNADYRLSLNASMWRTSYFKKYCKLGAGHWEWETRSVAKNDGAIILGTIGRYVLDFGHLFRLGNMTMSDKWYMSEYTKKELSKESIDYVENIINICRKRL